MLTGGHDHDPVLARRARIARVVGIGQRLGWGLILVAVVAFFVGYATGFPAVSVAIVVSSLAACTVILAPAIVFGYAIKAAEREDAAASRQQRRPSGP